MRRILASIVEYKLNRHNLKPLVDSMMLVFNTGVPTYPPSFEKKMRELIEEIKPLADQHPPSPKNAALILYILQEMEALIVDYLTLKPQPIDK